MYDAPHQREQQSSLTRAVMISFVVHLVVLVASSVIITSTTRLPPNEIMQVRIVGAPIAAQPKAKPVEPEPIRTQDSAAPKEPPPETKDLPESTAKTKMVTEEKPKPKEEKPQPVEAKKRPPVLDKTPEKKKVVKNELEAKVVRNPEDYLSELDFLDTLETENTIAPKDPVETDAEEAGEGDIIQLNLSEQGEADKIRQHIERMWMKPPGADTRNLYTIMYVEVEPTGNVIKATVRKGSGQSAFDSSIERAIRKASPLPLPAENRNKFLRLELHFQG